MSAQGMADGLLARLEPAKVEGRKPRLPPCSCV
jgi:hypothetical protein